MYLALQEKEKKRKIIILIELTYFTMFTRAVKVMPICRSWFFCTLTFNVLPGQHWNSEWFIHDTMTLIINVFARFKSTKCYVCLLRYFPNVSIFHRSICTVKSSSNLKWPVMLYLKETKEWFDHTPSTHRQWYARDLQCWICIVGRPQPKKKIDKLTTCRSMKP